MNYGPHQVELSQWIELAPFESMLKMKIEQLGRGRAVLSMPFNYELCQGGGVLHGGAITALADTAGAMAIKTLLPEGSRFGTIKLETEFVTPGISGVFYCEAQVDAPRGQELDCNAQIKDQQGALIARFKAVFKVGREVKLEG